MSENKWTAAQSAAISTKGKSLLLSAAAGSGKTTTLTERIIRSITDKEAPADISKMLIVTFTRASAADLKAKIFNAVSNALAEAPQDRHLTEQLIKLGSAKISTIDSFYLNAVRQNFSVLGLSSSFRIADGSETELLASSVMSEVTEKFYNENADFPTLCECFEGLRDTDGVIEKVLLSLYDDCMHTTEGVEYLRSCADDAAKYADKSFLDTSYGAVLTRYAASRLSDMLNEYERILWEMPSEEKLYSAYSAAFESDRILCAELLNMLEGKGDRTSYSDIAECLKQAEFKKLSALKAENKTEFSEYCKTLRDEFKSLIKELRDTYFQYSESDLVKIFSVTSDKLYLLYDVLTEFELRYREEKKRRNVLELTDVKRCALKLFANADGTPTEVARRTAESYTDIYIDEYQDVDPVQDTIFRCISTPHNRFMVGDIKQSIYSFRGAEPQLFSDYRRRFPVHGTAEAETSAAETIFMSENFRCSKPIISFTNLVCSRIFSACRDSIGYTSDDDLVYARSAPENAPPSPKVTVALFGKERRQSGDEDSEPTEPAISAAESEALYIANKIKELLSYGKKQNGEPIRPKDVAVLFRNKSSQQYVASALNGLGIKCSATEATQYFENPDVLMVLSILNTVDNPQRDVYLAGALKSPIYGFSLEDILLINRYGTESDSLYDKLCLASADDTELGKRCKHFNDVLLRLRALSTALPIDKFLKLLFSTDEFIASGLFCDKDASGRGGNLRRLYEYARSFEAGSFKGLYSFIEFINTVIENGKTIEARSDASGDDAVTLTTIHKSKGLEFPICFVCNAAAKLNTGSGTNPLPFEYGIGVAMDLSDSTGFARYSSPLKKLLELHSEQKQLEEEMRVLYVALTRAKEQLFVTGNSSVKLISSYISAAHFNSRFNCRYSVMSAGSYMDWILAASEQPDADVCLTTEFYTSRSAPDAQPINAEAVENDGERPLNRELFETLKARFAFKYPYRAMSRLPAKLSVSRLSPTVLDSADGSLELFTSSANTHVADMPSGSAKKNGAAERGTATHLFLQFCNFEELKSHGASYELDVLVQKGFIPSDTAELVYMDELDRFADSELMAQLLSAKRIFREQRFNILLPASEFTQNDEFRAQIANEKIAVQGVIDLILEDADGKISLYDYKTDRLTREQLSSYELASAALNRAHAPQLSYYARAVSIMLGKTPRRVAVYSTCASRLFDVSITPLELPDDIL